MNEHLFMYGVTNNGYRIQLSYDVTYESDRNIITGNIKIISIGNYNLIQDFNDNIFKITLCKHDTPQSFDKFLEEKYTKEFNRHINEKYFKLK